MVPPPPVPLKEINPAPQADSLRGVLAGTEVSPVQMVEL